MSRPVAYGIDFGTSNSAISIAAGDYSTLVPLGPSQADVMPSVIYVDSTRQRLAGELAVQQYLVAGSLSTSRLMSSIKSFLADPTWKGTKAPWGELVTPEELVSIIIADLKRHADRSCGENVSRVVLGHPVLFAGVSGSDWASKQELAKSRLEAAARLAGFDEIVFADEPTAAVAAEDYTDGIVVALDFGGGTFDVSVVENSSYGRNLLATHGATIGGERFDQLLFEGVVAEHLGLKSDYWYNGKRLPLPQHIRQMGTLHGILSMVGDDRTRRILDQFLACPNSQRLVSVDEILYGGHGYSFFRSVEGTKIQLSDAEEAEIRFQRPRIDVSHPVGREEFTQLISADLDRIDRVISKALADAGVRDDEVSSVIRTGGSSQIPAFVTRVNQRFGAATVAQRDALVTVAIGLGLIGLERFA